jgi:transposase, IS5 family
LKNTNPPGLFDDHLILEIISSLCDNLQQLKEFIDWRIFESPINEMFNNENKDLLKDRRGG